MTLLPVHNQWLTNLTTNSKGETTFFLPAFGYLLVIMGAGMFLLNNWKRVREAGWGSRAVVIPLLVIAGAIALSGIIESGIEAKFAPLGMGMALLAVYLAARVLGHGIFFPMAAGAATACLGVVLYQLFSPQMAVTGGYVFEKNYDIVVGYALLGAAVFIHRWRPVLSVLAIMAMLLTGSPEAMFSVAVVATAVLVRRDWTAGRARMVIAPLGVVSVLIMAVGFNQGLYGYLGKTIKDEPSAAYDSSNSRQPISYRLEQIGKAMSDIRVLGTGYSVTEFREGIVHNVPLVIVQQLGWPGVLAGLAWLWVTVYCLVRTKWKYVWVLVLSLSVWDHYVFTQLAPWWWAIAGASLVSKDSDLIFRKDTAVIEKELQVEDVHD